jgi:hypothetical protein
MGYCNSSRSDVPSDGFQGAHRPSRWGDGRIQGVDFQPLESTEAQMQALAFPLTSGAIVYILKRMRGISAGSFLLGSHKILKLNSSEN